MIDLQRLSGHLRFSLTVALLTASVGCGNGTTADSFGTKAGDSIPRTTFVATMVDLRLAAFQANNEGVLPPGGHEEVLARHGVTGEEIVEFVEVHGRNLPFMDSLWTEVEGQIRAGLEARVEENTPQSPSQGTIPTDSGPEESSGASETQTQVQP